MKNLIRTILRRGYTKSKRPLIDYVKYLYPLGHILKTNEVGWVVCNDNTFWCIGNQRNRIDLFHDIAKIQKRCISDSAYFNIINRFENGDKYGIEIE